MANIYGAPDNYCGGQNCNNPHCYYHNSSEGRLQNCLMANLQNDIDTYSNNNLICDVCKNDIINYINSNY